MSQSQSHKTIKGSGKPLKGKAALRSLNAVVAIVTLSHDGGSKRDRSVSMNPEFGTRARSALGSRRGGDKKRFATRLQLASIILFRSDTAKGIALLLAKSHVTNR